MNSPIWMRGSEEDGYYVTVGNNRVTTPVNTIDELRARLEKPDLELILNLATILAESVVNVYDQARLKNTTYDEMLQQMHNSSNEVIKVLNDEKK